MAASASTAGAEHLVIRDEVDIARELQALSRLDLSLQPIIEIAGSLPLRHSPAGLPGLASVVVGQQVSRASAAAIFGRLAAAVDLGDAAALAVADDETLRAAGLSRAKMRTLRAIAAALSEGRLDVARIGEMEPGEAIAALTSIHGIGAWTAECHLLFSAGHPDIFPAGDLALQAAAARVFDLPQRPSAKALAEIARRWSPHRSVAARLLWAYYGTLARRDILPVQPLPEAVPPPSSR